MRKVGAKGPAKGFTVLLPIPITTVTSKHYQHHKEPIFYTVNPDYLYIFYFKNSLFPPEPSYIRDFWYEGRLVLVDYKNIFFGIFCDTIYIGIKISEPFYSTFQ